MQKKLTRPQTTAISVMLFGMFFGAGNLIFPAHMGQLAGKNVWLATLGFIITGVGIPLLGVAALGISQSNGLLDLSSKIGKKYGLFFTCALYLTIGPFFAIPRCASVPFTVGVSELFGNTKESTALLIYSACFFALVLFFSLWPSKILTFIGKIITPAFLVFLCLLIVTVLIKAGADTSLIKPDPSYASGSFFNGFLEGYNTMDGLACLAFGIIVINVIKGLGVKEPTAVAISTVKAGFFSCLIMAAIYAGIALIGTQSRTFTSISENGGIALLQMSTEYFGDFGVIILAITITLACLKTAIGLVTSCAETFCEIFTKGRKYEIWAVVFCIVSFVIANLGLTSIINYAIPVLMFLYPLSITLILLSLFGRLYDFDKAISVPVTVFTLIAAVFDFINALPDTAKHLLHLNFVCDFAKKYIPLFNIGLGWIIPALAGLLIGIVIYLLKPKKTGE